MSPHSASGNLDQASAARLAFVGDARSSDPAETLAGLAKDRLAGRAVLR